jgi:cell division GTPase FtsZ
MRALGQAKAVLVQVAGGDALCLHDVADAVDILQALLPATCKVTAGVALDPTLGSAAQVMLLGLGLPGPVRHRQGRRPAQGLLQLLPRRLHLDLERGAYSFDPPLRQVG